MFRAMALKELRETTGIMLLVLAAVLGLFIWRVPVRPDQPPK